jgi:hypothetical protein
MDLPTAVLIIWWAALIVTVVAVIPLAIMLLHRTLKAAMQIERYAARSLEAGVEIAKHTAAARDLEKTLAAAPSILGPAQNIERHTAEIASILQQRAAGGPS